MEDQERELRSYAKSKGLNVVKVYAEKVAAANGGGRDAYDRVLQDSTQPQRPWDHLLVWSLERWSQERRFTRVIAKIEELEAHGVQFHSLKEPMIDSSEVGIGLIEISPKMGRELLRAILPAIASFERSRSEGVRVAMKELKEGRRRTRSGRPVGRPRRMTLDIAQRALELREKGVPWREVAQQVGLPEDTCRRARRVLSELAGSSPTGQAKP